MNVGLMENEVRRLERVLKHRKEAVVRAERSVANAKKRVQQATQTKRGPQ